MDERVSRAGLLYERAVFTGEAGPLAEADRELDAAEADLAVGAGVSADDAAPLSAYVDEPPRVSIC